MRKQQWVMKLERGDVLGYQGRSLSCWRGHRRTRETTRINTLVRRGKRYVYLRCRQCERDRDKGR